MFAVAYQATERGAKMRLAEKLSIERKAREQAQRAAREAQMRLEAIKAHIREEAAARSREAADRRREQGLAYQHSYAALEQRACRVFKLTRKELLSERRNHEVVLARQFLMYWTARLTKLSLPLIGKRMGGRDHTTILHGKNTYPVKRAKMNRHLRQAR